MWVDVLSLLLSVILEVTEEMRAFTKETMDAAARLTGLSKCDMLHCNILFWVPSFLCPPNMLVSFRQSVGSVNTSQIIDVAFQSVIRKQFLQLGKSNIICLNEKKAGKILFSQPFFGCCDDTLLFFNCYPLECRRSLSSCSLPEGSLEGLVVGDQQGSRPGRHPR